MDELAERIRWVHIPAEQRVMTLLPEPADWYAGWEQWRGVEGNQFFMVDGVRCIRPYGQSWCMTEIDGQTFTSDTIETLYGENGSGAKVLISAVNALLNAHA